MAGVLTNCFGHNAYSACVNHNSNWQSGIVIATSNAQQMCAGLP